MRSSIRSLGAAAVALAGVRRVSVAAGRQEPARRVRADMYQGAFGTWFSWQNTLQRAAPLILTALCTALPGAARPGRSSAARARWCWAASPPRVDRARRCRARRRSSCMLGDGARRHARSAGCGSRWPAACATTAASTRRSRSLLLTYIAIAIMNYLRRGRAARSRAASTSRRPTPIGDANMLGTIPGIDVHWGLAVGIVAARSSSTC